jgi:hypothetical protein
MDVTMPDQESPRQPPPSFVSVFTSAIAALFGVQSSKKHARDFARGKPIHYVIVGVIVTVVFVLTVWGLVKFALRTAGV